MDGLKLKYKIGRVDFKITHKGKAKDGYQPRKRGKYYVKDKR